MVSKRYGGVEVKQELKFPVLMESKYDCTVVLATSLEGLTFSGYVVFAIDPPTSHKIGSFSCGWCAETFVPLKKGVEIRLSND